MSIEVALFGFGEERPPRFGDADRIELSLDTPVTPMNLLAEAGFTETRDLLLVVDGAVVLASDWERTHIDDGASVYEIRKHPHHHHDGSQQDHEHCKQRDPKPRGSVNPSAGHADSSTAPLGVISPVKMGADRRPQCGASARRSRLHRSR